MALLANIGLHLLVISVNFWFDLSVDVLDLLDQLVHEGVHLVS